MFYGIPTTLNTSFQDRINPSGPALIYSPAVNLDSGWLCPVRGEAIAGWQRWSSGVAEVTALSYLNLNNFPLRSSFFSLQCSCFDVLALLLDPLTSLRFQLTNTHSYEMILFCGHSLNRLWVSTKALDKSNALLLLIVGKGFAFTLPWGSFTDWPREW